MKRLFQTAVVITATLGWWGFVYPELSMTETKQETALEETASEEDMKEVLSVRAENSKEISVPYYEYKQGSMKIRIKSKALEYLYQVKQKETYEKELKE